MAIVIICLPLFLVGLIISVPAALILALLGLLFVMAISSAINTIFISAVYHNIQGEPVSHFRDQFADNLFQTKEKRKLG